MPLIAPDVDGEADAMAVLTWHLETFKRACGGMDHVSHGHQSRRQSLSGSSSYFTLSKAFG